MISKNMAKFIEANKKQLVIFKGRATPTKNIVECCEDAEVIW